MMSKSKKYSNFCNIGTRIQTILFDVNKFTVGQAKKWLLDNDFKYGNVETTDNYHRFRQESPDEFKDDTFRTTDFDGKMPEGVKVVIGCPKHEKKEKGGEIISEIKPKRGVREYEKGKFFEQDFTMEERNELANDRLVSAIEWGIERVNPLAKAMYRWWGDIVPASKEAFIERFKREARKTGHDENYFIRQFTEYYFYDTFEKGGKIPNNYIGRTSNDIWDNWTPKQRSHFIRDHKLSGGFRFPELSWDEVKKLSEHDNDGSFEELKSALAKHKEMGQYEDGGVIPYSQRFWDIIETRKSDGKIVRRVEGKNTYAAEEAYGKIAATNPVRQRINDVRMEEVTPSVLDELYADTKKKYLEEYKDKSVEFLKSEFSKMSIPREIYDDLTTRQKREGAGQADALRALMKEKGVTDVLMKAGGELFENGGNINAIEISADQVPDVVYGALYYFDRGLVDKDLLVKDNSDGTYTVTVSDNDGISVNVEKLDEGTNERIVWDWLNEKKYEKGGAVGKYKFELTSWEARVHEDDYEQGEGEQVNTLGEEVNVTFDSADDLIKYIYAKILFKEINREDFTAFEEGRITTSLIVDNDNFPASEAEIEKWKKGELKLYAANYDFYVALVARKTPSVEELVNLFGIPDYDGQFKKMAEGGAIEKNKVLFDEAPLRIQSANGVVNFDFDSKGNTGWQFDTDDVAEAAAIIMKSKFKDNKVVKSLPIIAKQKKDVSVEQVIFWLSGGNQEWKFGEKYNDSFEVIYEKVFKPEFSARLKKEIAKAKTIGGLMAMYQKEFPVSAFEGAAFDEGYAGHGETVNKNPHEANSKEWHEFELAKKVKRNPAHAGKKYHMSIAEAEKILGEKIITEYPSFGNEFKELSDNGNTQIYVRDCGEAIIGSKKIPLVATAEILDLEGAIPEEELKGIRYSVNIKLYANPSFIDNAHYDSVRDSAGLDVEDYPNDQIFGDFIEQMVGVPVEGKDFKKKMDAQHFVLSKEMQDKLDGVATMTGFILDKPINRIGTKGWDVIKNMVDHKVKLFENGGSVDYEKHFSSEPITADSFEKLKKMLGNSGFYHYKDTPVNEFKHGNRGDKAVIGKTSVYLSQYTPNTKRHLGSKEFETEIALAKYLDKGQYYENGGQIKEQNSIVISSLGKLVEYSKEIPPLIKGISHLPSWVMSKIAKVELSIANVKHTLEPKYPQYFEKGGAVMNDTDGDYMSMQCRHIGKYSEELLTATKGGLKYEAWMEYLINLSGDYIDDIYHTLDYMINGKKYECGGNIEVYADGGAIETVERGDKKYRVYNGTFYHAETPDAVIYALDNAYRTGRRIKIYLGDVKTGRDWHEEHDTIGTVGRSTGDVKIPLLIATSRSMGGGAILDHCIVKIKDVKSGSVLYKLDNYQAPKIEIVPSDIKGYTHNVNIDGELYSRHKTEKSAKMLATKIMGKGGSVQDDTVEDRSLLHQQVEVINENDENLKFGEKGKVEAIIVPTKQEKESGRRLINYMVQFPDGEIWSYLRSEIALVENKGSDKFGQGGQVPSVKKGDLVFCPNEGSRGLVGLITSDFKTEDGSSGWDVYFRGLNGATIFINWNDMEDVAPNHMSFAESNGDFMHYPKIAKRLSIELNPKYEALLNDGAEDEYALGGAIYSVGSEMMDEINAGAELEEDDDRLESPMGVSETVGDAMMAEMALGGSIDSLNKKWNFPEHGVASFKELIDKGVFDEKFKAIENAVRYNRIKFNRMNGEQQKEYEAKINKKKTTYNLKYTGQTAWMEVSKQVFDYAPLTETAERNYWHEHGKAYEEGGSIGSHETEVKSKVFNNDTLLYKFTTTKSWGLKDMLTDKVVKIQLSDNFNEDKNKVLSGANGFLVALKGGEWFEMHFVETPVKDWDLEWKDILAYVPYPNNIEQNIQYTEAGKEQESEDGQLYKVVKIYEGSGRKKVLKKGLSLNAARGMVNSSPDSKKTMVVYYKMADGGDVTENVPERFTKLEFTKWLKDAFKQPNKWHFFNAYVDGTPVQMKFFIGQKEVDVQIFKVNYLSNQLPKNYAGKRETLAMIQDVVDNKMGRINQMVQNWKKEGRAFSHLQNDDKEFFEKIGVPYGNVGTTSQTGNDMLYYNVDMYEDGDAAIKHRAKMENGGEVTEAEGSMVKVNTAQGYDFYVGKDGDKEYYNIVPQGSPAPSGGFYAKEHISRVKGVDKANFIDIAIARLNQTTAKREAMINFLLPRLAKSGMSDKQYDALERKLQDKSFGALKKQYEDNGGTEKFEDGGEIKFTSLTKEQREQMAMDTYRLSESEWMKKYPIGDYQSYKQAAASNTGVKHVFEEGGSINYEILSPAPLKMIGFMKVSGTKNGGYGIYEPSEWDKQHGADFRVGNWLEPQYIFDTEDKKLRINPLFWNKPAIKLSERSVKLMGDDETWESGENLAVTNIRIDRNVNWSQNAGLYLWYKYHTGKDKNFKIDFDADLVMALGGSIPDDGNATLGIGDRWAVANPFESEKYEKGGEVELSVLAKEYAKRFKLKGNGRRTYSLFQPHGDSDYRQASRQLFPNMTYAEHEKRVKTYEKLYKETANEYNKKVDEEFLRVFKRPKEVTDYKISGIWRDEFSAAAKDEIRKDIKVMSELYSAINLHNSMLNKADKIDIHKLEEGGAVSGNISIASIRAAVKKAVDGKHDRITTSSGDFKINMVYDDPDLTLDFYYREEHIATFKWIKTKRSTSGVLTYYPKLDAKIIIIKICDVLEELEYHVAKIVNGNPSILGYSFVREEKEPENYRYISIQKVPHGLKVILNDEGREKIEDNKEKLEAQVWGELFDDVQGNSEYLFLDDGGAMGFGLTEAPMITDGYYYDDGGKFTDKGHKDSEVYAYMNYQIHSPLQKLLENGEVVFERVDGGGKGKKYEEGGDVSGDFKGKTFIRIGSHRARHHIDHLNIERVTYHRGIGQANSHYLDVIPTKDLKKLRLGKFNAIKGITVISQPKDMSKWHRLENGGSVDGGGKGEKYEDGGTIADMTEREFLEKHFSTSVFGGGVNVSDYFEIEKKKTRSEEEAKSIIADLKARGFTVKKKLYSDFISIMGVKKKEVVKPELVEFTIPDWASSALINDDWSGLEGSEDKNKIEAFIKKTVEEYGNANFMLAGEDELELGFKHSNDIDNLGANCMKFYNKPTKKMEEGGGIDPTPHLRGDEIVEGVKHKFVEGGFDWHSADEKYDLGETDHPHLPVYVKDGKGYVAIGHGWYSFNLADWRKHNSKMSKGGDVWGKLKLAGSALADAATTAYQKTSQVVTEKAHDAKVAIDNKIHDEKKKVALNVLDKLRHEGDVNQKEAQILHAADNIVESKFAAGGNVKVHHADSDLQGKGWDVAKLTPHQKDLIIEPSYAPENYYQNGKLNEKKAQTHWIQKLHDSGLNETDIAKAKLFAMAKDGSVDGRWISKALSITKHEGAEHAGSLRRKAKSLGWIKGEAPLTLAILDKMKKTAKKENWRQLGAWEHKITLAETLIKMPHKKK